MSIRLSEQPNTDIAFPVQSVLSEVYNSARTIRAADGTGVPVTIIPTASSLPFH